MRCTRSAALRRGRAGVSRAAAGGVDGSVLSPAAFALRFFADDQADDRLLDRQSRRADLTGQSFAEPLLAPPAGSDWTLQWSSEEPRYGGGGTPDLWPDGRWRIPAETALVLRPGPRRPGIPLPIVRRRSA